MKLSHGLLRSSEKNLKKLDFVICPLKVPWKLFSKFHFVPLRFLGVPLRFRENFFRNHHFVPLRIVPLRFCRLYLSKNRSFIHSLRGRTASPQQYFGATFIIFPKLWREFFQPIANYIFFEPLGPQEYEGALSFFWNFLQKFFFEFFDRKWPKKICNSGG